MEGTMKTFSIGLCVVICLLAISQGSGLLGTETALAAGLREHFEGKTIKIIHGSSPGGGYDLTARALARFLPEYLPGKPARIIVQPRPGGGPFRMKSLRALIKAKPDGLTVGYAYAEWLVAEAIGGGTPKFNIEDVKPLGTPFGGYTDNIHCTRSEVVTSWKDIKKLGRPILWGGVAPGIQGHNIGAPWLKELGAPIKLVWGYGGTTEMTAAFRRKELEFISSCTSTLYRDYPDWVKPDNVAPIFWVGMVGKYRETQVKILKSAGLERPPHIYEIAEEYFTADWQKEALEAGLSLGRLSFSYFVPAGVSKEIYGAWRKVFSKIVGDPRFTKALHPTYRDRLSPMYAEEMEGILDSVSRLSPEALSMLKILVEGR
jgi:tripartite-type tricarboxylate transporter receptor subunit TctC